MLRHHHATHRTARLSKGAMKATPILLLSLATLLAPLARADINIDIRLGKAPPPPPREVTVIEHVGPTAPPPWADTHRSARAHAYYFYPGSEVYYRPDNHTWFYLEGRSWRSSPHLPDGIRVDFERGVPLSLDTDRPYTYHEKVVTYYPSNYWAKVKFREEQRRDDRRDDHRDRDDHDRR